MQIKKRYVGAALALGVLLGFFIQDYVSAPRSGLIPVVVAGADIAAGSVLRSEHLQVRQWPRECVPSHAAEKVKQVEGKIMTQPAAQGEPILLPKLAKPVKREIT